MNKKDIKTNYETNYTPSLLGHSFRGALELLIYYPAVRLQTAFQTLELNQNESSKKSALKYSNLFNDITKRNKVLINLYVGFAPYLIYYVGYKAMLTFFYPKNAPISDIFNASLLSVGMAALYPFELAQIKAANKPEIQFKDYNSKSFVVRLGEILKNYSNASSFKGVSAFIAKNFCISYGIVISRLTDNKIWFILSTIPAVVLDNVRRNYIVATEQGTKITMKETFNNLVKERGYFGLLRGYLLYPYLLMLMSSFGKNKQEESLKDKRFIYSS